MLFLTFVSSALFVYGQRSRDETQALSSFFPTFYSSGRLAGGSPRLEVFPRNGKPVVFVLPFEISNIVYSPDGKALYGTERFNPLQPNQGEPGILKVEIDPIRIRRIPGSEAFGINSMSIVPRNKIVISGNRLIGRNVENGLFELDVSSGRTRMLVLNDRAIGKSTSITAAWSHLNVSPDGKRAVAMREQRLEVIDLTSGAVRVVSPDLELGAWSPDGKWLSAIIAKKNHTVLMDAQTFAVRRTFDSAVTEWSPDSRYLLGAAWTFFCGPYSGTLEAIDIENGRKVMIRGSHCKINGTAVGWLRFELSGDQ